MFTAHDVPICKVEVMLNYRDNDESWVTNTDNAGAVVKIEKLEAQIDTDNEHSEITETEPKINGI
jgi:hypothetical protein